MPLLVGPDFVEAMKLWTDFLRLQLYWNFSPFATYVLAHEPKTCQILYYIGPDFADRGYAL